MKIMLVHSSFTGGHQGGAIALHKAFQQNGMVQSRVLNTMEFMAESLQEFQKDFDTYLLNYSQLRRKAFEMAIDGSPIAYHLSREALRVKKWFSKKFRDYLEKEDPDAIISTHSQTNVMLSLWKAAGYIKAPIFSVLTDFLGHIVWAQPEIDHFYVAHGRVKRDLQSFGIAAAAITVSGMPVDPALKTTDHKTSVALREKLDLPSHGQLVMITGGMEGFMDYEALMREFEKIKNSFSVVAITSLNYAAYQALQVMRKNFSKDLKVLGQVDGLSAYLMASDIIVSKPGGMTTAEVLAAGKALIYYHPYPGMEEFQSQAITSQHAALFAKNPREAALYVKKLLHDTHLYNGLAAHARKIHKSNAAAFIARDVMKRISSRKKIYIT